LNLAQILVATNFLGGIMSTHTLMRTAALVVAITVSAAAIAAEKKVASADNVKRLADGHPDLNGVWENDGMSFINPQKTADGKSVACIVGCAAPKPAEGATPAAPAAPRAMPSRPKYKEEFQAKVKDLSDRQVKTDPALACGNPGLPRIGPPKQIVQTAGQIVFLYDDLAGSFFRVIPTDGRPHRADAEESYLGDSIGHWDGDTLVVEAVHFIEDTWLIDNGAFHTTDLKVTERIRKVGDKLEYQTVVDDPKVLAEPWQMRTRTLRLSKEPLQEPIPCVENDLAHMQDGSHHDNAR
jgi:hypothetical protein